MALSFYFNHMEDLELNKKYSYNFLEQWFDDLLQIDPNVEWQEYGMDKIYQIGHGFIVIDCIKTYSFILTGWNKNDGSIWKLIYKE